MASDQLSRRDNTQDERGIHVEKDRVPKITSHFESLSGKTKGSEESHGHHDFVSISDKDKRRDSNLDKERDAYMVADKDAEAAKDRDVTEESQQGASTEGNKEQYSFEEISKLRAQAQQKSNDAIWAAEEKYRRALQSAKHEFGEKGAQAKETCLEHAHNLVDKGQAAKTAAVEKVQQGGAAAKDTIVAGTRAAADYTVPAVERAKEAAVSTGGKAKDYTVQKAVEAKDATVDTSKEAAEYAGKTAASVKDKAAAAGWTAAHYSTEKAVDGTKAAARGVKGAAEYAGHKAAEIVAVPLTAARDMALSAGETAKGYTARKKEEAQRGLETKQMSAEGQECESEGEKKEESREHQDMTREAASHGVEGLGNEGATKRSSVLGAIGETIVEIAQTTKELVIGEDVNSQQRGYQRSKSS